MVGVHTSLVFSQIQRFFHRLWHFWSSLLILEFLRWQILFALLVLLGLPFCFWDPISFGHEYIKLHQSLLQPSPARPSIILAKQHNQHFCRHRTRRWQHRRRLRVCNNCWRRAKARHEGWASFPPPGPNLYQQLAASIVDKFITSHDPSQIMVLKKIFPAPLDLAHGMVTIPLTFVSTCGDMHCLSSSKIKSSLVIDSGALV